MKAFSLITASLAAAGMIAMAENEFPENTRLESHAPASPFQNGDQEIRVVLPDDYDSAGTRRYRVLHVLPVEKGFETKYGSGLKVLAEIDAHNRFGLILVQPGFEQVPWYGDHATDPKIRQESHLREVVAPFIEDNYRTTGTAAGRLLFGFSKSGWGAFSLILRDPEFWGYAAGWDSPMMIDRPVLAMEPIFGTQEQLDRYRPDLLVRNPEKAEPFQKEKRLVLTGEKFWGINPGIPAPGGGSHTIEFHELLAEEKILHHYDHSQVVPHRWDKRWVEPTLEALMALAKP